MAECSAVPSFPSAMKCGKLFPIFVEDCADRSSAYPASDPDSFEAESFPLPTGKKAHPRTFLKRKKPSSKLQSR